MHPFGADALLVASVPAPLEKTKLCKFFAKRRCSRGSACSFAHGEAELLPQVDLYKTQLCTDFMGGMCWREACRFAHGEHELRDPRGRRVSMEPEFPRLLGAHRRGMPASPALPEKQLADGAKQVPSLSSIGPTPPKELWVNHAGIAPTRIVTSRVSTCASSSASRSTSCGSGTWAAEDVESDAGPDHFVAGVARLSEVVGFQLAVRNTFITVDLPNGTGGARRAESCPPECFRGKEKAREQVGAGEGSPRARRSTF